MTRHRRRHHGVLVAALSQVAACLLLGQTPVAANKPAAQPQTVVPSAEDKQKALEADAARLVRLAEQLKTDLEHTRQDELSVKVLREADEIDRLARSTRTRIH